MFLTKKQLVILSILNVKPCTFKQLTKIYLSLCSETYYNYEILRTAIKHPLKNLRKSRLVKREGTVRSYRYSITTKGIQELIRHNLKRLIIVM